MQAKSFILSIVSAVILILSFPVFNIEFVAWFAFIPFFVILDGLSGINTLKLGFLTGLLFFFGLIYWVTHSMSNYGGLPLPVGVLILFCFACYLAIYFALFAWLLSLFQGNAQAFKWIAAPFIWTALELIRTHFLTGFPWGVLGYSQFKTLPIIQIADITGVYGISFLIIMLNVSLYLCFSHIFMKKWQRKFVITYFVVSLLFIVITTAYGFRRINKYKPGNGTSLKIALMQGNIDQGVKWNPAYKDYTLSTYIDMTKKATIQRPDLIVWPESALPFFFQERGEDRNRVINLARETGTDILVGSPAYEIKNEKIKNYNRAYLVRSNGDTGEYYDKIHLVPYGEFVPFKQIFTFINKMVEGIGDFSNGEDIKIFNIEKGSFSTLICYEIIFPNLVRKFVDRGADFLVHITNDAWFGKTAAPYQHISMITIRAVENRVPVVRAANTGISGIINPIGTIIKHSGIFEKQYLIGNIELRKEEKTFYTTYGDIFAYFCVFVSVVILSYGIFLKKQTTYTI